MTNCLSKLADYGPLGLILLVILSIVFKGEIVFRYPRKRDDRQDTDRYRHP